MADNSLQNGTDTIRDKDRTGVKTQIFGQDLNIGGASEVLQTASALADATSNPTVPAWATHGMVYNGSTWDRMRGDTTNGVDVDVTRLPSGTVAGASSLPAGTNNIGDVDVLTLPSIPTGSNTIGAVTSAQLPSSLGQKTSANSFSITLASDIPSIPIVGSVPAQTTASWTSATTVNTAATASSVAPYGQANVQIVVPSTVTAGVVTIEVTADGTNWSPGGAVRVDNGSIENDILLAFRPGTNGNRVYAVSLDSFTGIRARLSTVIAGSGTVTVIIAPAQQGIEPFVAIRPRTAATYGAQYRLVAATAGPYYLAATYTANVDKQIATIYHAATATKTVRLRYASVTFVDPGVAAVHQIEMRRLSATTAPATGNPAITPGVFETSDPAAEATCLALPTTAGSETNVNSAFGPNMTWRSGASTQQTDPARAGQQIVLFDGRNGMMDQKPPTMRAGVAEGFAIIGRCNTATTLSFTAYIEFTEEPA